MVKVTSADIKKVCVIGAGTMGSGIAAQVANAGIEVLLLDIASDHNRNAVAEGALERIKKSDPPLLMRKDNLDLISVGNPSNDDAHLLLKRETSITPMATSSTLGITDSTARETTMGSGTLGAIQSRRREKT